MRNQALTVVLVLIIGSGLMTGCGRVANGAGQAAVKAVTTSVARFTRPKRVILVSTSNKPHAVRAGQVQDSPWILWMYLVPGMGVFAMLAVALLRGYEPEQDHASLAVGNSGSSADSADWFVLIHHDSGEESYITETEQPAVEPIKLAVPRGSATELTADADSFGFFSLFGD